MTDYAIILAGGEGRRMQGILPKQFLPLGGRPMLMHSMEAFHRYNATIRLVLVLHPAWQEQWKVLCLEHRFELPHEVAKGGRERFHSVSSGLEMIPDSNACVAVHDAARPLLGQELIARCYHMAEKHGAVVPVVLPSESLRQVDAKGLNRSVDRSSYRMVQTPQCFRVPLLKSAYLQDYNPRFTDDASVVEALGEPITLIEGEVTNIKITMPSDLMWAEHWLMAGQPSADSG
ncbi:MAG TPA: 2-C-methyl-D-erythritol 4-phosphate cytidylyltransferase [Bacteroidales bacterium]|nr:2-C-methyl-D-erythritol 4-phosphate cytidylyltransferase [Bacteroidales bacterium]